MKVMHRMNRWLWKTLRTLPVLALAGCAALSGGRPPAAPHLAQIPLKMAVALAHRADSKTASWHVEQWMNPWLVLSAPVAGDGSNTQGVIFLVTPKRARVVQEGPALFRLHHWSPPGQLGLTVGIGGVSPCATGVNSEWMMGGYCAEGFTTIVVLETRSPHVLYQGAPLPLNAHVVQLTSRTQALGLTLYTPEIASYKLLGWHQNRPWISVVAQWDAHLHRPVIGSVGLEVSRLTATLRRGLGYAGQGVYLLQTSGAAARARLPTPSAIVALDGHAVTMTSFGIVLTRLPITQPLRVTVWVGGSLRTYTLHPDLLGMNAWLRAELAAYGVTVAP